MQYRRVQNPAAGYLGGAIGDSLNPGHITGSHGKVITIEYER